MEQNQKERKKKKVETFCSANLLNGKKMVAFYIYVKKKKI